MSHAPEKLEASSTPPTPTAIEHVRLLVLLRKLHACKEARAWCGDREAAQEEGVAPGPVRSLERLWQECHRGEWLLWIAAQAGVERKRVVLAACACARLALKYVTPGAGHPLSAIETAERWARAEPGVTLEQVRDAGDAAYAAASYAYASSSSSAYADAAYAAYAAASFAYAGDASFADAAFAATFAAAFAANAAANAERHRRFTGARKEMLRECAETVRNHLPMKLLKEALAKKGGAA